MVSADRLFLVTQITTLCNFAKQKNIPECTCSTYSLVGYKSPSIRATMLLSTKNKNLRLNRAQAQQY